MHTSLCCVIFEYQIKTIGIMTTVKLFKNGESKTIIETPLNRNEIIADLKSRFDKVLVDKYSEFEK